MKCYLLSAETHTRAEEEWLTSVFLIRTVGVNPSLGHKVIRTMEVELRVCSGIG